MAVCVYTKAYGDVARATTIKTWACGLFYGFSSPKTRRVLNQGKSALEEMEGFGNHLEMNERNKLWTAAVKYMDRRIEDAIVADSQYYRI